MGFGKGYGFFEARRIEAGVFRSHARPVIISSGKPGAMLFCVCRIEYQGEDSKRKKEFPSHDPSGRWGMKGIRRVLYRLPEVLEVEDVFVRVHL